MRTLGQVCQEMIELHGRTQSWRKTGARFGLNPAMARLIAGGYDPGRKIRGLLDLAVTATVVVMLSGEAVPDGAQVIRAELCGCGQWYISNHPRRRKCFVCSAYRRGSGRSEKDKHKGHEVNEDHEEEKEGKEERNG
jgi:hypothetical protein